MLSSLEESRSHGRLLVRLRVALASLVTLSLAALMCDLPSAAAQVYPSRPIRVITVTSAGGTSDIFMRALADEMHKGLGQPIVIENRPGGAFNIGARACAEAAPDGTTICILPGEPIVFNQFLFKSLAYDPAAFEPVTQLFTIVQALVVSKCSVHSLEVSFGFSYQKQALPGNGMTMASGYPSPLKSSAKTAKDSL